MNKNKKQTNFKKTFTLMVVLGLLSWIPLKAENDNKALTPDQEAVFTFTASQIPTPLEKPSLETSDLYALSQNNQTYNFSLEPTIPQFKSAKSLETYKYIQSHKKTHVFEKSLFEASLISNMALNAADYFSTREALKYEGLQEGNPLMKPFVKNDITFAAVKIGFTASHYFLMKKLYKKNKTLGWIVSVVSNLALSYVVSSNMAHIHKARNR